MKAAAAAARAEGAAKAKAEKKAAAAAAAAEKKEKAKETKKREADKVSASMWLGAACEVERRLVRPIALGFSLRVAGFALNRFLQMADE